MRGRAAEWAGGAAGALLACIIAKVARPFWPIPDAAIGFVTVHAIPKGIDTFRYVLLLALIPAGAFWAGRGRTSEGPPSDEGTASVTVGFTALLIILVAILRVLSSEGIHGPIDLFHAGHYLSPASDVLAGQVFFRDAFPFHGLAADGGLDALAFRIGGETLATAGRLRTLLDLIFFSSAVAVFAAVLRRRARIIAGVTALLLLTGALRLSTTFPFFRALPLLLASAAVVRFVRTGRRGVLIFAGAVAGLGLFWSLEIGVFSCAALLIWSVADPLYRGENRLTRGCVGSVSVGIAAALVPAFVLLAAFGALAPFVRGSWTILKSTGAMWDLPAPVPSEMLRAFLRGRIVYLAEAARFYGPVFFFGAIAAGLALRRRERKPRPRERVLLALLIFSVVGFRMALGRCSYSHTRFAMVVPALLFSAWLPEALFQRRRWKKWRLLGAMAGVLAFVFYAEVPESIADAVRRIGSFSSRMRGDGFVLLPLPRAGGARVPAEQAASLSALAEFANARLEPGETFYDFADAGALYFLLDRRNPARVYEASVLSADDWQSRAISDLERAHSGFVVVSAGQGEEAFDGVSIVTRCPRLAAWLFARYPEEVRVGEFVLRIQTEKAPSR
jgi:hypothetical protein